MGHLRVGRIPNTPPWRSVVGLVAGDAPVASIADATMDAAERGLELAARDAGLQHTLWLLARITIAAREEMFPAALRELGVAVPSAPSVFDIVGGFSEAVDGRLFRTGGRTDIGEMAQMAAAETVTAMCSEQAKRLFETTPEDVRKAVKSFSTRKGFSDLAHDFFSRLINRYLSYHLSRELSLHVGHGKRFADIAAHREFNSQMETTCRQAALIVKEFAGAWHSKTKFRTGITPENARDFAAVALRKIRDELRIRGGRDA